MFDPAGHFTLVYPAWDEAAVRAVIAELATDAVADIGLAVYLADCITGVPEFPTVDVI
jgi:hypothetical protein